MTDVCDGLSRTLPPGFGAVMRPLPARTGESSLYILAARLPVANAGILI